MQAIKTELLELLRRNDLLKAALLLGKVQDANFCGEFYIERIMELAARIWHRCTRAKYDPILKAESINHVLFKELGIVGKTEKYKQVIDDPNRLFLHTLMDTRAGSPLSITILYLILAEQVGLSCECVALPSYYYLKVADVAAPFYIDTFDGGKFLTEEEFQKKLRTSMQRSKLLSQSLYEKVTHHQLTARVVQQLKHIYILKSKALEALRAVELLTALFPQSPELTRDRGILYCEMEYFSKAMQDLRAYLKQRPDAEDVKEIRKLTTMLEGYREIMN
jgi:regulator of sirC expression with transglutaminase-like and TPR domain